MPFHQQIHRHAAATPKKPALVIDGEVRTYAELADRSRSFSAYVTSLPGSRKALPILSRVGKVVALDLGNHLLVPELFVGATEGRNACAVLDPKMLPRQLEDILSRLRPDLIVTATASSSVAQIARRMGLRIETAEVFEQARQSVSAEQAAQTPIEDDTFLIGFTSGTTSQPKAYSRSRASWRGSLERGMALFGLQDAPATMCPGGLAQGIALYALAETLYSGGTFHTVKQWKPERVAQALSRGDVDRFVAVPTMISALAERATSPSPVFPSIRDVVTAGAKLDRKRVAMMRDMFPRARLMEYYGASELSFVSVSTVHPADPETPISTVGKAFPGVEISIRSPSRQILGSGMTGTIYVKSDLICDGYLWGDDGQAFRADPSGATVGDIGELDPAGVLKVMGREGGMIITGGFNVYPSEVEAVLKSIAGVDEAIVLGVDDAHLGAKLVAILHGSFEGGQAILDEARRYLPRYKIPRDLYRTSSWPMTSGGKIARGKVAELLRDGQYEPIVLTN